MQERRRLRPDRRPNVIVSIYKQRIASPGGRDAVSCNRVHIHSGSGDQNGNSASVTDHQSHLPINRTTPLYGTSLPQV